MTRALLAFALVACGGKTATPAPEPAANPEPAAAPAPIPAPMETRSRLEFDAEGGPIVVTPVMHATTVIEHAGLVIWLDPWSEVPLEGRPKADIVLITDIHQDHMDAAAVAKISDAETVIVAPQAVADQLGQPVQHVLANGASVTVGSLTVQAVPMYNTVRGPDGGGVFHEKGRGNGYILTLAGSRLYFAGDTECTDEMKALTDIDVAFVPMNLPYTMPPDEAAACVKAFAPKVAVPYHYRGSDVKVFADALAGAPIDVRLAEFYPGAPSR